jgi:hypothetical protein
MKKSYSAWRRVSSPSALVFTAAALASGCTHFAAKRSKARAELDEHSRALTTAVVDTLQTRTNRDSNVEFALRLAREDQRIEGLPLDPIKVTAPDERKLNERFERIERLLAKARRSEERLLQMGEIQEQEQNESRVRWSKWMGGSSVVLGGLIALVVFVPAAAPILGRMLAWLVKKIPALAGALGVVSVNAFDAVVRGIERSRENGANRISNGPADSALENLELNLSREMDAAHKDLVRARKVSLSN